MDHFHILDAYRSNKKLIPFSGDAPMENVFKAAYQTKDKYDALRRVERAQTWALASVEAMVAVMAVVFVSGIALYSNHTFKMKVAYCVIVILIFVITGIVLYLMLFSKRMFNATRSRLIMEEIYRFSDDTAFKAYAIAQELRDLRKEHKDENSTKCVQETADPEVKKKLADLEAAATEAVTRTIEGASACKPGGLKEAMRNGMLYTLTTDAGTTIDGMVRKLRTFLGAETYRYVEEADAYDVIDDIIVPQMIKAHSKFAAVAATGGGERNEQCDEYCAETVEKIVSMMNTPDKAVSTILLDDTWERCPVEMEEVCKSHRLKTAGQRCAFGCNKVGEKKPEYSVMRVENHVPDAEFWTEQTGLESEEGASLEKMCIEAALDAQDVDAAYYGKTSPTSPDKCFFHFKAGTGATGRGTFKKSSGVEAFHGKLIYKEAHDVELPESSAAEIAKKIADQVRSIHASFDITPYDVHLYDTIRTKDAAFGANRGFYEDVFDHLVELLKPQSDDDGDVLVPSVQRINVALKEMTARKFRSEVVWPVAKTSVYLHVRTVRMDQAETYLPRSVENEIRREHNFISVNLGMSVAASIVSYLTFVVERESAKTPDGRLTLKNLIVDMWHRHVFAASVITMFWTIVFSWYNRHYARRVFNEAIKETNTRNFVVAVNELRTFLFGLTGTLPEISGDDDTSAFAEKRLPLMNGVHDDNMAVVKPFDKPEEQMINVLDVPKQIEFVRLSQAVVKAYDKCNKLDAWMGVPFPVPEVVVYGTALVILAFGMSYMYSRFNMAEVARRVQRVRDLRPKVYMGDASAAREIAGLLECSENVAETRLNLMKNMFVGMVAVSGIMVTVMIVNNERDYEAMLNSGFMASRGRCVS
jgi:hypothetical protein